MTQKHKTHKLTKGAEPEKTFLRRLGRAFGADLLAHRRLLAAAYAFTLLAEGLAVLSPLPLKYIVDYVIVVQPLPAPLAQWLPTTTASALALLFAGVMLLLAVADPVAAGLGKMMIAKVRERLILELRDRMMAHIQTLPPSVQTTQRSGELVLRLVSDVNAFAKLQTKFLPDAFRHLATCVLTLAMMAVLEPRLALLGFALIPALFLLVKHYNAPLHRASKNKRRYEGEVAGLAQEIIRGLPTLQALGDEARARQRFAQTNSKSLRAGVDETRLEVAIARTLQMAQGLATAMIAGAGALLVLSGQLTVGALLLFVTYMKRLMNPVEKINDLATDITRGLASGEQLLHLLEKSPGVKDVPEAISIGRARGLLEIKNVWFAYDDIDGQTATVLRNVDLRLEPGKLTALIGGSGNGKSTLLNLLLRLNEPATGEILLDKRPLRQYTIRSLRNQMAVMLQNTHLFAGTVREALGAHDVNIPDEKLWEALRMVSLEEFVRSLPKQLEAELGEDGLNFSGGQRKRLSLARAFLLDRPILLLDEPLANVDAASAAVILEALDRIRLGRTCLVITHEEALINKAGVVYHLENGQIEEMKPVAVVTDLPFLDTPVNEQANGKARRNGTLLLPRNGMLV